MIIALIFSTFHNKLLLASKMDAMFSVVTAIRNAWIRVILFQLAWHFTSEKPADIKCLFYGTMLLCLHKICRIPLFHVRSESD